MQAGKVIRPDAFAQDDFEEEFEDEFLAPPAQVNPVDLMAAFGAGVQRISTFLYDNRTTIRNVAVVAGGAYVVVKGPPILARSFAETAHFLREGWYGRGYEDRWLEDKKKE